MNTNHVIAKIYRWARKLTTGQRNQIKARPGTPVSSRGLSWCACKWSGTQTGKRCWIPRALDPSLGLRRLDPLSVPSRASRGSRPLDPVDRRFPRERRVGFIPSRCGSSVAWLPTRASDGSTDRCVIFLFFYFCVSDPASLRSGDSGGTSPVAGGPLSHASSPPQLPLAWPRWRRPLASEGGSGRSRGGRVVAGWLGGRGRLGGELCRARSRGARGARGKQGGVEVSRGLLAGAWGWRARVSLCCGSGRRAGSGPAGGCGVGGFGPLRRCGGRAVYGRTGGVGRGARPLACHFLSSRPDPGRGRQGFLLCSRPPMDLLQPLSPPCSVPPSADSAVWWFDGRALGLCRHSR
ncbi:uncharacterized protein LOC125539147 [Triticum urartu]|uniref:uncharacterized protein LOC125539147 n=1 Tax=Triticum urartu TaxID=4572 RepID=UPI002043CB36|nr:uncharacterized protein LOC125539147 [Triticum urartu]